VDGKMPIPVRPLYSISAVFKHISPFPSNNVGENSIPLYKLRVLDNLLDRFIGRDKGVFKKIKISANNIDSLIDEVSNKLKPQTYVGEQYGMVFRAEKGLIINLVA